MASAIAIPLARSVEALVVQPYEVTGEIVNVLRLERAPLEIWLECARCLLAQGQVDTYKMLLRAAIDEASSRRDPSPHAKFVHVQLLCSLADLHLQQARLAGDTEKRRELHNTANTLYFEAQRVDHLEMLPHLGLGEAALSMGDVGTARKEFENASRLRCNGRPSVAGMLALARLTFASGQYSEALALFRRVLRECPSCPADVRVGIGACHFRLGDVASAKAAYERAVEVDPLCTQALLGLAVLTLAVGVDADATQKGSRLLAQAFQQDPDNPHTLALLAHFSLQQGLAESALKLAQAALDRVGEDEPALKAEAVCLVGRAQHALGALPEALRSYAGALKEDRNQPIARFALAQLSILRGENVNAATSLESLLEDRPGWEDALRLLAPLCPRQATATAAARPARHFKLAAERRPDDAELWEMLGDVLAGADPAGALNAYSKAIELHRKKDKAGPTNGGEVAMPSRLLNNAAVLHMRGGNIAEALALVAESLASATGGGLQALGPQAQVTLGYNAARIREASGDAKGAEVEYKALLGQFPQYADCHLRLACLAKARGDIAEAESWAHRAAEASGRSADSLALMAGLHLERRDTEAAKRCLEELLDGLPEGASRQELYAKVGLGNVHLLSVPGELQLQENVRKAEAQLTNAMNRYRRVLDRDPGNVYAANGLGCVLAEAGLFGQARDVFLSVQEAAAGTDGFLRLPDAWINLASVYLGLKQYDAAEHTYVNAIRRFADPTDARLLLYLAKAQYDGGKPGEAAKTITRALHLAPSDPRLRFNLAYLLQEKAGQIVKKKYAPGDRKKPVELAAAERSLRQCHKMFEALHAAGKDATGIPPSKLVTHIKYAAEMHEQALRRARHATEEAQAAAALLEEQRLKMEAAAKRREMEEARKLAEAKALEQAREEMAREGVRKLERMKEEWRQGAVLSKAAAAGDSGAVVRGREREAAEPDAMDAMFADEEDDDDYDPAAVDEEFGGAPLEGAAALAAAGLASSDEEEADFEPSADEGDSDGEEAGPAAESGAAKKPGKEVPAPAPKPAKSKGGRLRKRERDGEGNGAGPSAGGESDEDGDAVKKARQSAVLDDSDEEEAAAQAKAGAIDFGDSDDE